MPAHLLKTPQYILLNKPYGTLCQFSDSGGRETLARYGPFPKDVYPAGRLDADSEGLVLLTNDGRLKHLLLDPKFKHPRTYLAQVEGSPPPDALARLANGVVIENRKTLPAEVKLMSGEPDIPPRPVPIRYRKNIPATWIQITLREGRNRQVRKMTAAVGHPTLRLVRIRIGRLDIGRLRPGEHRSLSPQEIAKLWKELL
jgi:23S rRNA pseudouridine2457 synthase